MLIFLLPFIIQYFFVNNFRLLYKNYTHIKLINSYFIYILMTFIENYFLSLLTSI